MSKQSRNVAEEKLSGPDKEGFEQFLVTDLKYDDGNYSRRKRGYYLTCSQEGRQDRNGMITRSFGIASGGWTELVEEAKRFSEKRLHAILITTAKLAEVKAKAMASISERAASYAKAAAQRATESGS